MQSPSRLQVPDSIARALPLGTSPPEGYWADAEVLPFAPRASCHLPGLLQPVYYCSQQRTQYTTSLNITHALQTGSRAAAAAASDAGSVGSEGAIQPRPQADHAAWDEPHPGHTANVHVRPNAAPGHEVRLGG